MKIFIEGSPLFGGTITGVGEYTQRITEQLARKNPRDRFYIGFIGKLREAREVPVCFPNVIYRPSQFFPKKVYNLLQRWSLAPPLDLITRTRADVAIFFSFFRHRLLFTRKSITVIHDVAFAHAPEFSKSRGFANSLDRNVRRAVRVSSALVAVSRSTKQDLISRYQADPGKISIINPALNLDNWVSSKSDIAKVLHKHHITQPYLLFLGTIEPRKNVDGIIKAYQLLPPKLRDQYLLVIAGSQGWGHRDAQAAARKLPKGRINFTGYLEDSDKAPLYAGASLFLFPSHYEGWGMPVLEAMACGTPVITARNSSLPEVGGNAAYYIKNSRDTKALAKAITLLLNNRALRNRLAQRGRIHVKKFSWSKSASQMSKLVHMVTQP